LNFVVIGRGLYEIATHAEKLTAWKDALYNYPGAERQSVDDGRACAGRFPKLALGLSGFETGVVVMPLIKNPNRITNTRKLLATAAIIMSFMLIASSIVTTVLIPAEEFQAGSYRTSGEIVRRLEKPTGARLLIWRIYIWAMQSERL
jgi:hypothetical protein